MIFIAIFDIVGNDVEKSLKAKSLTRTCEKTSHTSSMQFLTCTFYYGLFCNTYLSINVARTAVCGGGPGWRDGRRRHWYSNWKGRDTVNNP